MPCSICKQPGHNKRSCPHANTFVSDDNDCCVCMSPIKTTNRCTTKCGHNFCLSCFFECSVHKSECPICRTKFNNPFSGQVDKLQRINMHADEYIYVLEDRQDTLETRIAELEKTNAELYQKIKWYDMQLGLSLIHI